MTRSSFEVIGFDEHLGDVASDLNAPGFRFTGDQTTERVFEISGDPKGAGYVILQLFDVENRGHKLFVNGKELPGVGIVTTGPQRWQDTMEVIPDGMLRRGGNRLQLRRAPGGDNLLVGKAVVHWKEEE